MKCPHCLDSFHEQFDERNVGRGPEGRWNVLHQLCPECGKSIIFTHQIMDSGAVIARLVYPKAITRTPLPPEVDDPRVVRDYNEASLVMDDSAQASAALSRRCLQHILREKAEAKSKDLADQIQEVLDSNTLPTDIAENLDAVRASGNFATHPIKSKHTGEIIEVEPHEAEWNLEVLEQIIDFYYVRPALAKKKRDQMNEKLTKAGKPPLK